MKGFDQESTKPKPSAESYKVRVCLPIKRNATIFGILIYLEILMFIICGSSVGRCLAFEGEG